MANGAWKCRQGCSSHRVGYRARDRAAISHENGAVIYQRVIPENATIQLTRGSREDILADVQDAITTIKEKAANRELQTLLCFSCAGRRMLLGLDTKKELELVVDKLPASCAVNGFYGAGEIGPIDSSVEQLKPSRFHNTTLVLCALRGSDVEDGER